MPEPSPVSPRPGQERFVADPAAAPQDTDAVDASTPPTSMWADAWHRLRRRPLFLVAALLVLLVAAVTVAPGLFTSQAPRTCDLAQSLGPARPGHPFGFDRQGCDVYARVVHGARASVTVGLLATLGVVVVGGTLGALAGFYGGLLDTVLSRLSDVFIAVPLVLGAIVGMQATTRRTALTVATTLTVFGWPQVARVMRGAVLEVRQADFVTAARATGASSGATLLRHAVPNAAGPVIVVATISLGIFIGSEATLSFLGVGLPPGVVSWGGDINLAQKSLRVRPSVLLYPAAALSVTVLGFVLLGDAVRDALDPRGRTR